jgi:hypothetical protein
MFEQSIAFHETLGFQLSSLDPAGPTLSFAIHPNLIGIICTAICMAA